MQLEVAPPLSRERKARRYGIKTAARLGYEGAELREQARLIQAEALGGSAYHWQPAVKPLIPLPPERIPQAPVRALVIRPDGLVEALAWRVRTVAPRRQATTSRRRPGSRATARAGASRDGPESDLPPVGLLRGFPAASVRMVQHLQRRNAAMRLA